MLVQHLTVVNLPEVLAIAHLGEQKRVLEHKLLRVGIGAHAHAVVHVLAHLSQGVLVEAIQPHHVNVAITFWHFHGVVVELRIDVMHRVVHVSHLWHPLLLSWLLHHAD